MQLGGLKCKPTLMSSCGSVSARTQYLLQATEVAQGAAVSHAARRLSASNPSFIGRQLHQPQQHVMQSSRSHVCRPRRWLRAPWPARPAWMGCASTWARNCGPSTLWWSTWGCLGTWSCLAPWTRNASAQLAPSTWTVARWVAVQGAGWLQGCLADGDHGFQLTASARLNPPQPHDLGVCPYPEVSKHGCRATWWPSCSDKA